MRNVKVRLNKPQRKAGQLVFKNDGGVHARRTVFLAWSRGVGKSHFHRTLWWTLVALLDGKQRKNCPKHLRGVRVVCLAPTLKQWKDIFWADIENDLLPGGKFAFLGAKLNAQRGAIKFPGGSIVRAFPAATFTSKRIRGMRADLLCADEVDDIDSVVVDAMAGPILSEPWSIGLKVYSGTPGRGKHGLWYRTYKFCKTGERLRRGEPLEAVLTNEELKFYREVLAPIRVTPKWHRVLDADEDKLEVVRKQLAAMHMVRADYRDVPEYVSEEAVAEALATLPAATFKREWLCDPTAGEGLVYSVFDEDFHIVGSRDCPYREVPDLESFDEFHVGVDFGWSDPGVLLLFGVRGKGNDAAVFALDEHYTTETPNHVWVERAKAWNFANRFWADTSSPDLIDMFRREGCKIGDVVKDINPGIARTVDMMFIRKRAVGAGKDEQIQRYSRFYVARRCKNLINELGRYAYKRDPSGDFTDDPIDKHNHACDATRYFLFNKFGVVPSIKTVVAGR